MSLSHDSYIGLIFAPAVSQQTQQTVSISKRLSGAAFLITTTVDTGTNPFPLTNTSQKPWFSRGFTHIWRVPERGVPPNHPS